MKAGEKTRQRILKESDRLFYTRGYNHTSFGDIVKATGLSKGNITYHFKTKRDILEGIIAMRLAHIRKELEAWEAHTDDPMERLALFCDMIVSHQDEIEAYGCPMGTLTAEFAKSDPELYEVTSVLFLTYKDWLSKQYAAMGAHNPDEAALCFLSRVQGAAMVAHAFQDRAFLAREIGRVKRICKEG